MRKLFYASTTFLTLLLILTTAQLSKATHYAGADLTYAYTGTPNTYTVSLKLYRDCCPSCSTFGTTFDVCISSANLGVQSSLTCTLLPGSGQQIPPSPCVNSPQCYEEYIYQNTVTLPGAATDWVFTYNGYARNNAISTLQNPGGEGLTVQAFLDNATYPTNSSPVFSFIPIVRFCVGNQFYFDQGATDVNSDSLVFSLAPPEGSATTFCPITGIAPVIFLAPYTYLDPFATVSGVSINPQTGVISFTPTLQQIAVLAVKVEEYTNGMLKGSVKRDIQLNIVAGCNLLPPAFDTTLVQVGINANCGDTSVILTFDQPIQCGSAVPTDIRVTDPNGLPNPVISVTPINCVNGLTDSLLVNFYFPLIAGSTYLYTKTGNDGNTFLSICGTPMPEFDSLELHVVDTTQFVVANANVGCYFNDFTLTFSQEFTCGTIASNLSDFSLVDANGTNIPFSSVTSNCDPLAQYSYSNTFTFHFTGAVTGVSPMYLIVNTGTDLNTIANKCGSFFNAGDTLAVINILNNILVDLGTDIIACNSEPAPVLDAGITGTGVTYQWYFNGSLLTDTTQTIVAATPGTYSVIVSYGATCAGGDTIDVTINSVPIVDVTASGPTTLCTGDPFPVLSSGVSNAGSYQWYLNGSPIGGATDSIYTPSAGGLYTVIVSSGGTCNGTDSIQITINAVIIVTLGNDTTICSSDPPLILTAVVTGTGVSYQWYHDGALLSDTTQTIIADSSGAYSVIVASSASCSGDATVIVTIIPSPVVDVTASGPTILCTGDPFPQLSSGVTTAVSYQWNLNGSPIPGATDSIYTPTAAGIYSVIVNTGATCNGVDSIEIIVNTNLPIALGTDIILCQGDPVPDLNAGSFVNATYQWYDGAGNPIAGATDSIYSPTASGTYSVIVTSSSGCTGTDQIDVTINPTPVVTIGPDATVCITDNFILTATSGYTYQWYQDGNLLPGETNQTYTPTVTGTYSVVATGTGSCTSSAQAIITVNTTPPTPVVSDLYYCSGTTVPTLASNVTAGSYQWYDGSGNAIAGATDSIFTPLGPGNYSVIVSNGTCTATDAGSITEVATPLPVLNNVSICPESTSQVILDPNVSITGATYQWSLNSSQISGATNTTYTINPPFSAGGTYTVDITNSQGGFNCYGNASMAFTVYPAAAIDAGAAQSICEGTTATFTSTTSDTVATYLWSNGDITSSTTVMDSGYYYLTMTNNNGCSATDSVFLAVTNAPAIDVQISAVTTATDSVFVCETDPFPLLTAVTPNTVTYNWTYNGGSVGTSDTYQVPSPDGANTSYGIYTVEVTDVTTLCKSSSTVEVLSDTCATEIPNIITPDGDPFNEYFVIQNIATHKNNTVQIFNRWGNKVFDATNYDNMWNGEDLPDGTYFVIVTYPEDNYVYKGTLTKLSGKKQ